MKPAALAALGKGDGVRVSLKKGQFSILSPDFSAFFESVS